MSVSTGQCTEHLALLEDYRIALHDWRVARTNDPLNSQSLAVIEATKRLQELEHKIKAHQAEHGCWLGIPLHPDG